MNAKGVMILGTPVGTDAFIQEASVNRLEEERRLWEAIPLVPDVQCGWQILLQCAGPRCHHFLRTISPAQVVQYAEGHDEGMRRAMAEVLGGFPGTREQQGAAREIDDNPQAIWRVGTSLCFALEAGSFFGLLGQALSQCSRRGSPC